MISAKTQADYDGGYEAVRTEVAEFHVAAQERTERIDAVQYAAAVDVDAPVQRPRPMLPCGNKRYDGNDGGYHGANVQNRQPEFRSFRSHDRSIQIANYNGIFNIQSRLSICSPSTVFISGSRKFHVFAERRKLLLYSYVNDDSFASVWKN